ncbi:retention module-containing protein [Marinomonas mediterranea]|uniref:retention module-containing protein n=1 Tax=Marinomonas mediterranea TaxID=119864 RepID=UPI00234ACC57|nr:retention module-containing protein [Marinomonas mediterranea]WCN11029.1 retention module-containing protein [Marinomonas mediterranea]
MDSNQITFATLGNAIGYAQQVSGTVEVHSIDGQVRTLNIKDSIYYGETVVALGNGSATIVFDDGTEVFVNNQSSVEIGDNLYRFDNDVIAEATNSISAEDTLQQAILAGEDPTLIQDAPAAGEGLINSEESPLFVSISNNNDIELPTFGYDTTGFNPILISSAFDDTSFGEANTTLIAFESTTATVPTQGSTSTPVVPDEQGNTTPEESEPNAQLPSDDTAEPEDTEPEDTAPETTEPEVTEPEATEPESGEPNNDVPETYYASIDVDIITSDKIISSVESAPDAMVTISGWVSGDARPGDTVQITLEDMVIGQTTVSETQDASGRYLFDAQVQGSTLAQTSLVNPFITATVSDNSGVDSASSTEIYKLDLNADIEAFIEDANRDQNITFDEQGNVKVGGWIEEGGQVTSIDISDASGNVLSISNDITMEEESGWSYFESFIDVSSLNDGSLTVVVNASDALGNVGVSNTVTIEKDTSQNNDLIAERAGFSLLLDSTLSAANSDFFASDLYYANQLNG